jgi:hypothetical protein
MLQLVAFKHLVQQMVTMKMASMRAVRVVVEMASMRAVSAMEIEIATSTN